MENKKKRRGMLAVLLGLVLTVCGGALTLTVGGRLEYILPAPAATQEGGELNALYEEAQKQMASIADSITAGAVCARAQGVNLSAEAQSAEATVYAVGSGYFDVTHETLLDGRLISEADVKRAENVVVIDERMALSFFAGNEPVGQTVTLSGLDYEVAGVIKAERRLGETNEHIAYIPITSASANALTMQTVEMIAKTADKTTGSAILMENTLKTWQPGGSFYNYDKLALGAAMPTTRPARMAGFAQPIAEPKLRASMMHVSVTTSATMPATSIWTLPGRFMLGRFRPMSRMPAVSGMPGMRMAAVRCPASVRAPAMMEPPKPPTAIAVASRPMALGTSLRSLMRPMMM